MSTIGCIYILTLLGRWVQGMRGFMFVCTRRTYLLSCVFFFSSSLNYYYYYCFESKHCLCAIPLLSDSFRVEECTNANRNFYPEVWNSLEISFSDRNISFKHKTRSSKENEFRSGNRPPCHWHRSHPRETMRLRIKKEKKMKKK